METRSSKKRKLGTAAYGNSSTASASTYTSTAQPGDLLKSWSGSVRVVLGYSGPPGSKNVKVIKQESCIINSADEMNRFCENLKRHHHLGSKGPAGKRNFTPELDKWRKFASPDVWNDHAVVVVVNKTKAPTITSVALDAKGAKVFYTIKPGVCCPQEVQYGCYGAVLVRLAVGSSVNVNKGSTVNSCISTSTIRINNKEVEFCEAQLP